MNRTLPSKKHDKNFFEEGKPAVSLNLQLKSLQEKNDALMEEQRKNMQLIEELKAKFADLEVKKQVEMVSAETQTVYEFQDIPCKDCIYVAS